MSRPRLLHPLAWWLWALGLAWATMRTTNIALLIVIAAVAGFVVSTRRSDAVWAGTFRLLLLFGLIGIVFTVLLQVLIGVRQSGHQLLDLPQWALPSWTGGLAVGGPVTAEALLDSAGKGLRLAVLLVCFGAANSLAHPARLLKLLPAALYELGVAIVVALTFVPQMTESFSRVRDAQRLRGRRVSGIRGIRGVAVPVLTESLDRAILLAASMDSRGYGRHASGDRPLHRWARALLLLGLVGALVGSYFVIDPSADHLAGTATIVAGTALAVTGGALSARRVSRTRYRPDIWSLPEWLTLACATVVVGGYLLLHEDPNAATGLHWPALPIVPFLATLVAALPGVITPGGVRTENDS